MASSENSLVSERSQAYIVRKLRFKSKNWGIKCSVRGETGSLETNAYVILQNLGIFVVVPL